MILDVKSILHVPGASRDFRFEIQEVNFLTLLSRAAGKNHTACKQNGGKKCNTFFHQILLSNLLVLVLI